MPSALAWLVFEASALCRTYSDFISSHLSAFLYFSVLATIYIYILSAFDNFYPLNALPKWPSFFSAQTPLGDAVFSLYHTHLFQQKQSCGDRQKGCSCLKRDYREGSLVSSGFVSVHPKLYL